jgi:hypothetical protein
MCFLLLGTALLLLPLLVVVLLLEMRVLSLPPLHRLLHRPSGVCAALCIPTQ